MVSMPQVISLSFTTPSHLRVCVDCWHPTKKFWSLSALVLLQTNSETIQTFSGSAFACAISSQDEWSSTCACCCPVYIALRTWLLVVLLCHISLFCGEEPKPPFLNGRICCQVLEESRRVPLSVKTQSSSCACDRVMVFWNPATLKLWRFSFRIKPFKQFSYKTTCRFTGVGNLAWRGAEQAPVSTQWLQTIIKSVHALWFCSFRLQGIGCGEQALLTKPVNQLQSAPQNSGHPGYLFM